MSSMREYVEQYLHQYPELGDLLAADSSSPSSACLSTLASPYPAHLDMSAVLLGLRNKTLLKGTLRCKRDDWRECYVVVHTAEGQPRRSVQISGETDTHIDMQTHMHCHTARDDC